MIIITLLLSLIAIAVVISQITSTSMSRTMQYASDTAQANNAARSGITAAEVWFQRQLNQPVASFAPTTPDTIDPSTGLVQQYPLSSTSQLWARYEVLKDQTNIHGVKDITALRMPSLSSTTWPAGTVWYIESEGYIYQNINPSLPYNTPPNKVVAHSRISQEIYYRSLNLPSSAPIITSSGSLITTNDLGNFLSIYGVNNGFAYGPAFVFPSNTGTPTYIGNDTWSPSCFPVSGSCSPITGTIPNFGVTSVFGVSTTTLRQLADITCTGAAMTQMTAAPPTQINSLNRLNGRLIYVEGDTTISFFQGSGILFVDGNLTFNNTSFYPPQLNCLIYVTGNASISGGVQSYGIIMVQGALTLFGFAQYTGNPAVISNMQQMYSGYREIKTPGMVFNGFQ